jgi:hypothetical protein
MMEASRTSETSVDIQLITRQYIPEDSERQLQIWLPHWDPVYNKNVGVRQHVSRTGDAK